MPITLRNFGRNVAFSPQACYAPRTVAELFDIMTRHRGEKIRVQGSMHSWSEAAKASGVALDMRHFNEVSVSQADGRAFATVGAGCRIKRVIQALRPEGLTLPTIGVIDEQTLVGAAATGTHGSGRPCLSHFIVSVTAAVYDPDTDEPVLQTLDGGIELAMAKCSLGCVGVIVEVRIQLRPQYNVEEYFAVYDRLGDVLSAERDHPLQQTYLLPWVWRYYAQHRRESDAARSRFAEAYRAYCLVSFDVALHLVILAVAQALRSGILTRFFFRRVAPAFVVRGWSVVERSDRQLTMEHDLFRHIEIELFVGRSHLEDAVAFLTAVLVSAGDAAVTPPVDVVDGLSAMGLGEDFDALRGSYTHHYPICIRKVEPDDTLISMSSGGTEAHYAISLISYARPRHRGPFLRLARLLTVAMGRLFQARPHWGKVCPIDAVQAERLYPRLGEFRHVCRALDPEGRFRNEWVSRVLF